MVLEMGWNCKSLRGVAEAAHTPGLLSELVLLEGGIQPIEEAGVAVPLGIVDGDGALPSPLCSYPPSLVGEPGYSNWVVKCVMKIFPLVRIINSSFSPF